MTSTEPFVHPYIPNSVPATKKQMMDGLGVQDIDEFYKTIPAKNRLDRKLNLPNPFLSEYELRKYIEGILSKNLTCQDYLNFKGGGCWQHYVPAVCDEINQRGEFLSAYDLENYQDYGKYQALYEYTSMMGELLNMDVVNIPTYDWLQAAATSIRMASRMNDRYEALVIRSISPEKLQKFQTYCAPDIQIRLVDINSNTGETDLVDLRNKISDKTSAVYFENPSFFGIIDPHGEEIAKISHDHGAEFIVGVNPISLGVLKPPADYGADIVCGDIQPFGMHIAYGSGQGGFIATRDEPRYIMEFPSRLFGLVPTLVEGEYGFGDVAFDRLSWAHREEGKEFVGTSTTLWAITAAVYLSLMGPQGMKEIGEILLHKTHYAIQELAKIKGVQCPVFGGAHFNEFVVDFNLTGKTVAQINRGLQARKIFGGIDLSQNFPEMGNCALFCITEIHQKEDIDRLCESLKEVVQ